MECVASGNREPTFESGSKLPTINELIEALNQLDRAMQQGDSAASSAYEKTILGMVEPGLYEGYVKDDDTSTSIVSLIQVKRERNGANIHSFVVDLLVMDGDTVSEACKLDLFEFLQTWCRVCPLGRSHYGPRFQPF